VSTLIICSSQECIPFPYHQTLSIGQHIGVIITLDIYITAFCATTELADSFAAVSLFQSSGVFACNPCDWKSACTPQLSFPRAAFRSGTDPCAVSHQRHHADVG